MVLISERKSRKIALNRISTIFLRIRLRKNVSRQKIAFADPISPNLSISGKKGPFSNDSRWNSLEGKYRIFEDLFFRKLISKSIYPENFHKKWINYTALPRPSMKRELIKSPIPFLFANKIDIPLNRVFFTCLLMWLSGEEKKIHVTKKNRAQNHILSTTTSLIKYTKPICLSS